MTVYGYGSSGCGSAVVQRMREKVSYKVVVVLSFAWWSVYCEGLLKALLVKSCQLSVR